MMPSHKGKTKIFGKEKHTHTEVKTRVYSMVLNPMLPLALLVVVSLVMSSNSSAAFPIAKPGCDDHCRNVSIPFPFGTRKGCYLDERFYINCSSSNNAVPPQPLLGSSTINVTDILLDGQLRLMQFVGYDCYYQQTSSNSPWIELGRPMTFNSTANKFTVIGCDTYSYAQGSIDSPQPTNYSRQFTTGCMSMCSYKEDVVDGSCSGLGCCQTSIPSGTWQINVSLGSYDNHSYVSDFNPCSYAFVVENNAFEFFADNLTNLDSVLSLPVVVDWVIEYETCEAAQKNSSTYVCGKNSQCYVKAGTLGYRCTCKEGYEGNPYLANGCQDINECGDPVLNKCANHSICVNTLGSYACNCTKGYHGDGKEVCIADQNHWPIFAGVGVSTGTAVLLAFSFYLYFELTRRKAKRLREEFFKMNGGLILQQKLTGQGGGTYITKIFTIEELRKATNDFDESKIIGRGGFGTVFRGELIDKKIVAIKKSRGVDQHQVEQFINEVIILSGINSKNVVKLLGCCLETEVPYLVYEYINNGTLFEHLHNKIKASKLSWNIRLRIASEIAGVLSYLHSIASPPIIHRDIKSANILLDQNYTAKVSDFGISRLVPADKNQVSTLVQGTHGYLDPEYMQTGLLTEKSDVYSFGIVLVELLTGKKALASDGLETERFLSNHFLSALKENQLAQVLDSNISCNENIEQLKEVAMIAENCICVKGEDRPYMKDVERELEVLVTKAKQISIQVYDIDSSKSEALLGMPSNGYGNCDDSTSSDLYPVSYITTEQPLLKVAGGR